MSLSTGLRHRLSLATEGKGESDFFGVECGGIQTGPALARKWKPHELSVVSVLVNQAQPIPFPVCGGSCRCGEDPYLSRV